MSTSRHIVVFSHGFGVRFDDRHLFTDIATALGADVLPYLFDYNEIDETARILHVPPFSVQVEKLRHVIAQAHQKNLPVTLICHSQGAVIAALAQPAGVQKTILLAPPLELTTAKMVELFGKRPGSEVNLQGVSKFTRKDGTTTLVNADYWPQLDPLKLPALYQDLAARTSLSLIAASRDEMLGTLDYAPLGTNIRLTTLEADHNFTGLARAKLTATIKQEFAG